MTLYRSKKYEGLGLKWERNLATDQWCGYRGGFYLMAHALEDQMQAWLDAGHIKPVKETKIVRVEGCVAFKHRDGGLAIDCAAWRDIPDGARSNPFAAEFEVEA